MSAIPRLVLAATALFALVLAAGNAKAAYWCEPLHAYYPITRTCPEPWQAVDRRPAAPPLAIPSARPPAAAAPGQHAAAAEGDQPTFTAPANLARGDALDQWCKGQQTALNIAVCGDAELRALAIERLRAFDDAQARLAPDRQKVLVADQNGWAMSYPQGCGLNGDAPPILPLAPALKNCLEEAGRQRLQYLRTYGTAEAKSATSGDMGNTSSSAPAPTQAAPAAGTNPVQPGSTPSGSPQPPPPSPQPPSAQPPSAQPPSPQPPSPQPPSPPADSPQPASPQAPAAKPSDSAVAPQTTPAAPQAGKSAAAKPAPERHSSNGDWLGGIPRAAAMLIAMLAVAVWAVIAVLGRRRRTGGKIADSRPPAPPRAP